MSTFYFNTGVKPEFVTNFPYEYHEKKGDVIRETLLIPFECDAPEDAKLMYLCNNPNLPASTQSNVKVCKVTGGNMLSEYAYFII